MGFRLLPLIFLLSFSVASAQNSLSFSRQNSLFTYIYKIDPAEASKLTRSSMGAIKETYLHTLIDSFSSSKPPVLLPGNYLFVNANRNKLAYELKTVNELRYKLVNNNRDLEIALYDFQGNPITDAKVYIRKKRVLYDPVSKTYRLAKYKKQGLVSIYYSNVFYSFDTKQARYKAGGFFYWLGNSFPLKYLVQPIKKLFHPGRYQRRDFFYSTRYEKNFRGFMVFSKPKYKPGDSVKLKAFITDHKGKPVKEDLVLRICNKYQDIDTIIAVVKPYGKGGYEYSFVLNDSLDLDLDDEYLLTLEELRSRKYDLDKYDGDDDDAYIAKRKVLMRGKFNYEEYELKSVQFTARIDKKEHHRGELAGLFLKATDENEMAIMDGRVNIIVTTNNNRQINYPGQDIFIPDTLWVHGQPLETIGETKVTLPDSIFPRASFDYEVRCEFLNADNESRVKTLYQSFLNDSTYISFKEEEDSIRIEQMNMGVSEPAAAFLYQFNIRGDTVLQEQLRLPATIQKNPFVSIYKVKSGRVVETFEVKKAAAMVNCLALRTKDSLKLQLVNPAGLNVWYTVFAGKKIILRGYGDSLFYTGRIKTPKNCFVSLQYIYGDKVVNEDYTIPFMDKLLSVKIDAPPAIYPGQTSTIDIEVKDAHGRPVNGADLTAYSFTSKFENAPGPDVPYLGKRYPGRKRYNNLREKDQNKLYTEQKLNWVKWSREMKLDTIEYYKFLHPQALYINVEPAKDSITQIAPFVVVKGEIQPIELIYIDERPVFFSQAEQLERYSFRISEGKHSLRIRTQNQLINLDSFRISKGVKTFVSINGDTANKRVSIRKMPDTLTNYEKNLWSKYMILVQNNFGERFAYLRQQDNFYLLNYGNNIKYKILAGPLPDQYASLIVQNKFSQDFEAEGAYEYEISKGLIKQKQLKNPYPFRSRLSYRAPEYNFHDLVLSERDIDSLWRDYLDHRSAEQDLFYNSNLNKNGNGSLEIGIKKPEDTEEVFIRNILLFRYDDPDFARIYKGKTRSLGFVRPGMYRLFFLLKDDAYYIKDSIHILADGINYYAIGPVVPKPKDSISTKISTIIENREQAWRSVQSYDLDEIKESFNSKYLDSLSFTQTVTGVVHDEKGRPVAFASVYIKGTRMSTVTDVNGVFHIKAPESATIVVSSVGYNSQEVAINASSQLDLSLTASSQHLDEVVVVGYSSQRRKDVTGSISSISGDMLSGKAAGVLIRIRGTTSIHGDIKQLIIVDGLPYPGSIGDLDSSLIESISFLKGEDGKAIYGNSAADGVIIIKTKKGKQNVQATDDASPFEANSLRRNFRDEAFWQPRLRTDAQGKASFKVTFPDDITNWKTYVIAMGDKKQTGYAGSSTRSFKAISGKISLPQFAIAGDSVTVIGKSLNYLMDSIQVKRSFRVNRSLVKENRISFTNSWLDSFMVAVPPADSLKLTYTIEKDNGYFDGEERSIPVFRQGVEETNGFFAALDRDSSFTIQPFSDTGFIKLYAEASLLPVWEDEIESIRRYEYLCNEQLASKLKALLVQKKIDQYHKIQFKGEKNILDLVKKLNQNKSEGGLWGWWNNTSPDMWISLHVMEALLKAEQMGYAVSLNKRALVDYLVYKLESIKGTEKITGLQLLYDLDAKADFRRYTDTLDKYASRLTMYEKLRLAELKQEAGLAVSLDTLVNKPSRTMFGNTYWGREDNMFFDNSVQNTLLVYRLLRSKGGYDLLLRKTRNFFLEQRRTGHWRNTYESSLILETILPDLLAEDSLQKPARLEINASQNFSVAKFPFSTQVKGGVPVTVSKSGSMPVYFTAYEQHWNERPEKVSGSFSVETSFERNGVALKQLTAGQEVKLIVKVNVKGDASYVMVEVPVPAGCSYQDKAQTWYNNEVHREYFKNKVSIFCSALEKGVYSFAISLMPRYTGFYNLNPAKAELMYFPVFYGRESEKKVLIK